MHLIFHGLNEVNPQNNVLRVLTDDGKCENTHTHVYNLTRPTGHEAPALLKHHSSTSFISIINYSSALLELLALLKLLALLVLLALLALLKLLALLVL